MASSDPNKAINICDGRARNLGHGPPENRIILPTRRPRVAKSPIGWPGQPEPPAVVDASVQTRPSLSRRRITHDAETSMHGDPITDASATQNPMTSSAAPSSSAAADDGQRPTTSALAGIKTERSSGMVRQPMVQVKKEVLNYFIKDLPEYQGAAAATWHTPQSTPAEGGLDAGDSDTDSAPSLE